MFLLAPRTNQLNWWVHKMLKRCDKHEKFIFHITIFWSFVLQAETRLIVFHVTAYNTLWIHQIIPKLNCSKLKLHKMQNTEVQILYQVLSYANKKGHYIIWQPGSRFNQTILHDLRWCSAHHYFNLLCAAVQTFQFNVLQVILHF